METSSGKPDIVLRGQGCPLRGHFRCSQTHQTHEPLLICFVSFVLGLPLTFVLVHPDKGRFSRCLSSSTLAIPCWCWPAQCLCKATGKWGGINTSWRKPLAKGEWEPVDNFFPLPLSGASPKCIHSCGLSEDGPGRGSNRSCLIPSRSQLYNAPLPSLPHSPFLDVLLGPISHGREVHLGWSTVVLCTRICKDQDMHLGKWPQPHILDFLPSKSTAEQVGCFWLSWFFICSFVSWDILAKGIAIVVRLCSEF